MYTDISICNSALLLVNTDTINSFSDQSREAALCNQLYETTKNSILQKYPWGISLFQEKLARTTNTPLFDFEYEYQLPTGYLRIFKTDLLGNRYRILKDKLFSDETAVEILFQKDPGEEFYPAYLRRLIELKMASIFSLALVQDENMAQSYESMYRTALIEARGIDSQNSPNLAINPNELSLVSIRGTDS